MFLNCLLVSISMSTVTDRPNNSSISCGGKGGAMAPQSKPVQGWHENRTGLVF